MQKWLCGIYITAMELQNMNGVYFRQLQNPAMGFLLSLTSPSEGSMLGNVPATAEPPAPPPQALCSLQSKGISLILSTFQLQIRHKPHQQGLPKSEFRRRQLRRRRSSRRTS